MAAGRLGSPAATLGWLLRLTRLVRALTSVEEAPMPAPGERSARTERRLSRRQWLLQMGVLAGGGLLAACTSAPAPAPTAKPTEAAKPAAPAGAGQSAAPA